jgi:large subunit ribosomal protein L4
MPQVDLYNVAGKKDGKITLPGEIFGAKVNKNLMAQAVRVYLSNQRKAKAKAKNRSEVTGSRRKVWRQKGTGRARHGDRYAPIFVGGGKAHGPTGQQNYHMKMSKKMKRQALFSALSVRLKEGRLVIVKGLAKIEPKTKAMATALEKLPASDKAKKKTLVLVGSATNAFRAAANLPGVILISARQLNAYSVLNGGQLVFMNEAIPEIKATFLHERKGK